jgi:hypothetical protein
MRTVILAKCSSLYHYPVITSFCFEPAATFKTRDEKVFGDFGGFFNLLEEEFHMYKSTVVTDAK